MVNIDPGLMQNIAMGTAMADNANKMSVQGNQSEKMGVGAPIINQHQEPWLH